MPTPPSCSRCCTCSSRKGASPSGRCDGLLNGLDAVERAVAGFAPESVGPRCGIAAETIRRLAREFSEAPSAAIYGRLGTCVQRFGTLASWAIDLVAILTGNLDRPGGSMFANAAAPLHCLLEADGPVRFGRWQSRVAGRDEVLGEFPTPVLAEEIEKPGAGQIRALVTVAGNLVRTYPNSARLERAIAALDFMVCLDYYRNETTRHADLILPPTGPLERGHYDLALNHFAVRNVAKWSAPVLESEPAPTTPGTPRSSSRAASWDSMRSSPHSWTRWCCASSSVWLSGRAASRTT